MLNKIYIALLAVAVLAMGFMTYYAASWLSSIGSPRDALAGFEYFFGIGGPFLYVSSIILLITANALHWQSRRSWALWATLLYFVFFLLLRAFWLGSAYDSFLESNSVDGGGRGVGILLAIIFSLAAGAFIFFNELIAVRLNERIYPPIEANIDVEVAEDIEEASAEDKTDEPGEPI